MPPSSSRRCFLFKPDGIGDFFIASGAVRLLAREFGEENLILAVLPVMEPVVNAQFPRASVISLPLRTRRKVLNLFVANCLRCFRPWVKLLKTNVDVSISLRYMRDYLQNVLFSSVPSTRRFTCSNLLLGNGRPVRRWTERVFIWIFGTQIIDYPDSEPGVPTELAAHRLVLSSALGREVDIREIWPELRAHSSPPLRIPYWVCAPFSSSPEKDFPLDRLRNLLLGLGEQGELGTLVLTGSGDQRDSLEQFLASFSEASEELGITAQIIISEDLQKFIDLLAGAKCVVTMDTAAAHAATALDCRTLVLFSGKHQGMFAPWIRSGRQQWLMPKSGLPPDHWHQSHTDEEILGMALALNASS